MDYTARLLDLLPSVTLAQRQQLMTVFAEIHSVLRQARREGLLSLDDKLETVKDNVLRRGLRHVVDGEDISWIQEILLAETNTFAQSPEQIFHDLFVLRGLAVISEGYNPIRWEDLGKAYLELSEEQLQAARQLSAERWDFGLGLKGDRRKPLDLERFSFASNLHLYGCQEPETLRRLIPLIEENTLLALLIEAPNSTRQAFLSQVSPERARYWLEEMDFHDHWLRGERAAAARQEVNELILQLASEGAITLYE